MIKIYSMNTCPDCTYLYDQIKGNDKFEVIDIGSHVKLLKEFIAIRDTNPLFDDVKFNGSLGIPCFVLEDGTVTITPEDVGLESRPVEAGQACSIDGKGC